MTLAEYFALHRPEPKFQIGQRVIGKYEGVPFIGTCGCDNMVNETIGPMVTVFLDLPLKTKTTIHYTFIKVKYKDIKLLKEIELDSDEPKTKRKKV